MGSRYNPPRDPHGERYAKERQNYTYGGDTEDIVPIARYGEMVGLGLTPSGDLDELMKEFLTPAARAKLGDRALRLTSKRYVYLPFGNSDLQKQRSQYEQNLHDAPVVSDQHFHIEKKIATRDDVDAERFSIAFKVGISATFHSRIFAQPFFMEDEGTDSLIVGHVFNYDKLVDAHELDEVCDEMSQALEAHHPTATRRFAPNYFTATNLRTELRKPPHR